MAIIKIVYVANVIVAGWIGIISMFFPKWSAATIFQDSNQPAATIRLVGCLWLAISLLSALGLLQPLVFSPVLLLQLIYKGAWLLVVAIPSIKSNRSFSSGMAMFFLLWVAVLPFVIDWTYLFDFF